MCYYLATSPVFLRIVWAQGEALEAGSPPLQVGTQKLG